MKLVCEQFNDIQTCEKREEHKHLDVNDHDMMTLLGGKREQSSSPLGVSVAALEKLYYSSLHGT